MLSIVDGENDNSPDYFDVWSPGTAPYLFTMLMTFVYFVNEDEVPTYSTWMRAGFAEDLWETWPERFRQPRPDDYRSEVVRFNHVFPMREQVFLVEGFTKLLSALKAGDVPKAPAYWTNLGDPQRFINALEDLIAKLNKWLAYATAK